MARLKALALSLGLFSLAWAIGTLNCKQEIRLQPLGNSPPTDVTVDSAGRLYVLYEGDGYMDIYDKQGQLLEHRGGQAEIRQQLTGVTPLSQWVGRLGKSALLVSEAGQQVVRGALVPGPSSLEWTPFSGLKEPISGPAALARDLEGRFWVWSGTKAYAFSPSGVLQSVRKIPTLRRPVQLAVDSQGLLYCLDTRGLAVIDLNGKARYIVEGAQAMYLTGSDVLALAGRDWLRQYSPDGQMLDEVRELDAFSEAEPIALSINDEGHFFVYLQNPDRQDGVVLKLSTKGKILSEFAQPSRIAVSPDPGTRLDYQGRIHLWNSSSQLLKIHPSGKTERNQSWIPSAEPKGQLVSPADLATSPDGQVWVADSGNCRLQHFRYGVGWSAPIAVGIQNGDPRGIPRSLAFSPYKLMFVVVHPRNREGSVVLQTRNLEGKLLAQRDLCPAFGDPVVKVACNALGETYLYQSRAKTARGWEDAPTLLHYTVRGQLMASAGGDGPGLSPPKDPARRITLKPQEDLVPRNDRLWLTAAGSLYCFSPDLQPLQEYQLNYKQGRNPVYGEFGGAAQKDNLLYLVDSNGRCLQRVLLP